MAEYNLTAEFADLHAQINKVNLGLAGTKGASEALSKSVGETIKSMENNYNKLSEVMEKVNKEIAGADPKNSGIKGYVAIVTQLTSEFQGLANEVKKVSNVLKSLDGKGKGSNGGKSSIEAEKDSVVELQKELKKLQQTRTTKTPGTQDQGAAAQGVADLKAQLAYLEKIKQKTIEVRAENVKKTANIQALAALKKEEAIRANINKLAQDQANIEGSAKLGQQRLDGIKQLEKQYGESISSIKAKIQALEQMKATVPIKDDGKIKKINGEIDSLNQKLNETKNKTQQMGNTRGMRRFAESLRLVAVQIASVWTIARALGNAFKNIVDFQYTMTGVAAVTGGAASEMRALKDMAIELGGATIFTAKQFAELQLSLGKLGFKTQEIMDATKAVGDLTAAFGGELSDNAAVAGSTLRAFRMEASQMSQITDTMAQAFSSSALDVEKFRESMKFAAPVAQKFGFSVQQTTALLSKLADAGLYGSLAGTSLRNIMLKLADSGSELNKTMGFQVETFEDFVGAMQTMSKAGFDLGDALDITDQRAVTAISTLMSGSGEIMEFADSLEYAGGAAARMADERMETLKGALNKVKSAWQGMVLEVMDTEGGFMQVLNNLLVFLAKNMKTLTSVATVLGFTLLMITNNKITRGFTNMFESVKDGIRNYRTLAKSIKAAALQQKIFSLAKLGAALAPAVLTAGIALYRKLTARMRAVKDAQKEITKGYTDEMMSASNLVAKLGELQGTDKETIEQREKLYKMIEDKYPGILKNLDHEEGKLISQLDLIKEINRAYREKLRLANGEAEIQQNLTEYSEALKDAEEQKQKIYNRFINLAQKDNERGREMAEILSGVNLADIDAVLDKVFEAYGGGNKLGFQKFLDKVKEEYDEFIDSLVSGSKEAFTSGGVEGYEKYLKDFQSQAVSKGIKPLEMYNDVLGELVESQEKAAGNPAMVKYYQDQIDIVNKLIEKLKELKGGEDEAIDIRLNLEGWNEVLKINNLEEFQFQKKLEKYADVIKNTGLWREEIKALKDEAKANGEIFSSYEEMKFFQGKLKPGLAGKKAWEEEASRVFDRDIENITAQFEAAQEKWKMSDLTDDQAKADMQYLQTRMEAMIKDKEAFLKIWESLYSETSKGKKSTSDLQKVLKAIYEERKAYIERTYTDTAARDVLLMKLETQYQHQLSKITMENQDERLAFQLANYAEFIRKSQSMLEDYVKDNEKAAIELREIDPFGIDADNKAIAANKKKYADMRKEWNGQKQVIKGVADALDAYLNNSADMSASLVDDTKTMAEQLKEQLSTEDGRNKMLESFNKLREKGVPIESKYYEMIKSGNIEYGEILELIKQINKQIEENTKLSVEAEARMNFHLQWVKVRNEAKKTYDAEMSYIQNMAEARTRGFDTGMSGFHAEMMSLNAERKQVLKEYNELANLIEENKLTGLIPESDIQAAEAELRQLGYTLDDIRNKIYDTGKQKTFLDYITWQSKSLDLDQFGNVQYDKEGNALYKMGSLTNDQQEGIRQSVTFMKDMAIEMADAWKDAIDAVVAKYDELISASDSKIGELQNDLDREKDLLIEGYANNYDAVAKELELEREKRKELRKQREKALAEQARAAKLQERIEQITQAANIFTTVTEIVKQFSKKGGPAGWILGLAAAGGYVALIESMKSSINKKYKTPTARQGTTGVLSGKSHESGGESIPVEAESGERYSIFSRAATKKYGTFLEDFTNKANTLSLDSLMYGDVTPVIAEKNKEVVHNINDNITVASENGHGSKQVELLRKLVNKSEYWEDNDYYYKKEGEVVYKARKK